MKSSFLRLVLPLAALAFVAPGSALAQKGKGDTGGDSASGPVVIPGGTVATTYVIDQPGSYVLGGNRTVSDATKHAIEILAPDVTVDLGGFALTGGNAGIRVWSVENVEIRNGTIANAYDGIYAFTGSGLRVLDVRIVSATRAGVDATVGNALYDRVHVADAGQYGIFAKGKGTLIVNCIVNAGAVGVAVNNGACVERTLVHGATNGLILGSKSSATGCTISAAASTGIYVSSFSTLRNVDVMGCGIGVYSPGGTTNMVIMGSHVSFNTTNISGAYTNGGGNVIP